LRGKIELNIQPDTPAPPASIDMTHLDSRRGGEVSCVAIGAGLGAALGLAAQLYLAILRGWPDLAQLLDDGRRHTDPLPDAHLTILLMPVMFAPFAEEFCFGPLVASARS
jgi:hypothetical protein